MSCLCDVHDCTPLAIPAGLPFVPRAPGTFVEWRREILTAIGQQPALSQWRARESGDLGLMLAEMAAYVFDVCSFHDGLTASSTYLGTVPDAAGPRRLLRVLGYRPRPAFGSVVWLAAEADGVRLVNIPAGTQVRSGEFPGSAPQIFEFSDAGAIEPRINRFAVDRVAAGALPSPLAGLPVVAGSLRARTGQVVVIAAGGGLVATRLGWSMALRLRINRAVTQVDFATPVTPPAGATYANTRLLVGGARCGTWKKTPAGTESAVLSGNELSLESRVAIAAGDIVAVEGPGDIVARKVLSVSETDYTVAPAVTSKITDSGGNVSTLESPPVKTATTRITLDIALPFAASDSAKLVIHYAMHDAARIHVPLKDTLAAGDPMTFPRLIDPPRVEVNHLALEDVHGEGVVTTGKIDAATHSAELSDSPAWVRELMQPVTLFGNVFRATRGETVADEFLGVGDSSVPRQSFRLKKKPLTYLAASNSAGRVSSLSIRVGGIAWHEVESFYGHGPDEHVYVVTHNDEGEADIEFGGCARLPTGSTVIADYRFGAGAAVPPADSVKQLVQPVAGIRSIRNILPAFGGSDAEGSAEIRSRGPNFALLLGRAVSLIDIEAAAARQPGVRSATASWRWDKLGLRPAVAVRYIGDPQLAPDIREALRALAEEDAPISVVSAGAQAASMMVDVTAEADHDSDLVAAAVGAALFAPVSIPESGGLLRPERQGPDTPLFASQVIRTIIDVPGVAALNALQFDGTPFTEIARVPTAGAYFDFAAGGVRVNGKLVG